MRAESAKINSVYVVSWPESGVFKVGYSAVRRWRQHASRGAVIVQIFEFEGSTDAFYIETFLQEVAVESCLPAFDAPNELSRKLLGYKSIGYLECFAGSTTDAVAVIDRALHRALLDADAQVGA